MDINIFRSLITVAGFLCFLGICVWAYSNHSKAGFDEAARLPLADDDLPAGSSWHEKEVNKNG
mgnify:FL=1